jgi:hypothetical protein
MRDPFVYYRCEVESSLAAGATAAAAILLESPMRSSFGASAGRFVQASPGDSSGHCFSREFLVSLRNGCGRGGISRV